jgi:saccharopine dehydrogenase-like NADP-dependent oxidoreductase
MTGIPTSIGLQALARGEVARAGVIGPEAAFEPVGFFKQLGERGIAVSPA